VTTATTNTATLVSTTPALDQGAAVRKMKKEIIPRRMTEFLLWGKQLAAETVAVSKATDG
jgi:hypothetical protein